MALARRSGSRFEANIWPGFVDAMTALLLVLMFVLSIFMVVQTVLRDRISGQDKELDSLSQQVAGLFDALGLAQQRETRLEDSVNALNADLSTAQAEREAQASLLADLTLERDAAAAQNAAFEAQVADFESQVASLLAQNTDLGASLDQTSARLIATQNELTSSQTSLAQSQDALSASQSSLTQTEQDLAARNAALAESQDELAARDQDLTKTRATLAALKAANAVEISQKEALQLALAQARSEVDEAAENARLAAARREALDALIADLQADLAGRDADLASQNASLEQTLKLLATNQDELGLAKSELTMSQAALEGVEEQAADLRTKLAESQATLNTTRDGLAQTQQTLDAREADLRAREKQLADAQASGRQALVSAEELRARLAKLENELTAEEKQRLVEVAAANALRERLRNSSDELNAMSLALEQKRREAEETLTMLAAANAATASLRTSQADQLSERERQKALLATARTELTKERTLAAENRRKLTLLNQQTAQLRRQLSSLQTLLDASREKDEERNVEVQNLGSQLNTALAQVAAEQRALAAEKAKLAEEQARRAQVQAERAEEQARIAELERRERQRLEEEALDLRQYQSEFFARVGEVLRDRDGIQIQGDRFVFSSEVLFEPGSDVLGIGGQVQIAQVASVIRDVAGAIPESVDWVLRVDGHTDNVPLSGSGVFADNWELSQARALSVVKYLIGSQDIPPARLAANGFGEFQPVDLSNTPVARARNRRIELKFTER